MKKIVLISVLMLQLYNPLSILAQTDVLSDVLPLSEGNQWVYSFNLVTSGGGGSSRDTGYVNYSVLSSTISQDSIIWHMYAKRNFMRYLYGLPDQYIEDSTDFDIIELNSGQHKLYTPVYDQFSLFPFFSSTPDSESFYRFQETDINGQYLLDITFFPDPWNPVFGYNVNYSLKTDVGILSSQAFQFKGFPNFFSRTSYYLHSVNSFEEDYIRPIKFYLSQNYPNPFNPSTKISWQSPVGGWQTLKVYDVLGNEVRILVNEYRTAGSYEIEFNGRNLSSGIYFYRLQAGEYVETKKMILLR